MRRSRIVPAPIDRRAKGVSFPNGPPRVCNLRARHRIDAVQELVTGHAGGRLPAAIAYCLLGGISLGAASALQGIYTSQLADPRHLGMLFGAQQAVYGAGGAACPALGADLLALTGSYRPVMAAAAVTFLASAALLRPTSPPPQRRCQGPAA